MAIDAFIDRVDTLEAEEKDGVVTRVVRRARVTGLTSTDYLVLMSALTDAGLPVYNDPLPGAANLVLRSRTPKIVDGDTGTVDVDLVYEMPRGTGQSFSAPHFGLLLGEVQSTVNQVKSNTDSGGRTITVEHTYPDEDPDFPGETKVQGGEIEFFQPQSRLILKGVIATTNPWLVERYIVGKINDAAWAGRGSEEWMCTGCTWRLLDSTVNRYEFSFEFQHNPDTWNPVVVFTDERTGKPPPDLIEGEGIKRITKHEAVNFDSVLGVRLQGG